MKNRLIEIIAPTIFFIFFILIWEVLIYIYKVPHYIIPKPSLIFITNFIRMAKFISSFINNSICYYFSFIFGSYIWGINSYRYISI